LHTDHESGHHGQLVLVPVAIFVLAGIIAHTVGDWVTLLVGIGTLGGMVGAGIAAYKQAGSSNIARASAIGGAAGLVIGVVVLVVDAIWG
jgi:hypothetical protein